MSQILINDYLQQASGSQRETLVREAFKDLLKAWGRQHDLVFLAGYPLKTATRSNIAVDGALLHELRLPLGYREAKDAADDLDDEIAKKFKKGYPQDNIIFSDDATAVLWQNRQEVQRCGMTDTHPPREVRHLPIRRLQGKSHRPAGTRDHGERGNRAHRAAMKAAGR